MKGLAADVAGSVGVFILLLAFGLSLSGRIKQKSLTYELLNVIGALLCCVAAALIGFVPFVVLEGCWALVAVAATINRQVARRPAVADRAQSTPRDEASRGSP